MHVTWMTLPPAPDCVLELCNCSDCRNGVSENMETVEDVDSDVTYDPVDSDSDASEF